MLRLVVVYAHGVCYPCPCCVKHVLVSFVHSPWLLLRRMTRPIQQEMCGMGGEEKVDW